MPRRTASVHLDGDRVEVALDELRAGGALGPLDLDAIDAALTRVLEAPPQVRYGPDHAAWTADQDRLAALGRDLAETLLGAPDLADVRARWTEHPPDAVRLLSRNPRLLALPWELTTIAGRTLVEDAEILREATPARGAAVPGQDPTPAPAPAVRHPAPLRVAIVSPRPDGPADVPVYPALGPMLGTVLASGDAVDLTLVRPPTLASLTRVLETEGPFDVVHFDGHGRTTPTGDTDLVFEAADGSDDPVPADAVGAVLSAGAPRVVLLNACRSAAAAATLCDRLPTARVVAMRYAVSTHLVEFLMSSLYPRLAAGSSLGAAVRATCAEPAAFWREHADQAVPTFVNLTVWGGPASVDVAAKGDEDRAAVSPIDWREAAPAFFWAKDIERLHQELDEHRFVAVAGTLASETRRVVDLFAEYAVATGVYTRRVTAAPDDAPPQSLDGALVVVRAGSPQEAAAVGHRYAPLLQADGHGAVIVTLVEGRALAGAVHVGDHEVPGDLIASRLAPLLRGRPLLSAGRAAAETYALVLICQDDPAMLAALARLDDFDAALALVEAVEWGASLDGLPHAAELRAALFALEPEHARLVSLLGLSGGALVHIGHPLLLTAGGVTDRTFSDVLGREAAEADWTAAIDAAGRLGLFRVLGGYPPPAPVMVTALQALALREHLAEWVRDDATRQALQRSWCGAAIPFTVLYDKVFADAPVPARVNLATYGEQALSRALEAGLRHQDDTLAAGALHQLLVRPVDGTQGTEELLHAGETLIARYDSDALPDVRAVLLAWQARHDVDRELWPLGLRHAEAALAVPGATWRTMPKTYVLIMAARALWRSARTAEAEARLAEAAREAGPGEADAVASACADFAQYLGLGAAEAKRLRERVGAPPEPDHPARRAQAAEAAGDLDEAVTWWLKHLSETRLTGSRTARVFALEEVGRFFAIHGSHEGAVQWLGQRLQAGAALGLDPEQPLRYLGLSAERAGRWDEARSWLRDALEAARAKHDERAVGECLYELAIVELQTDEKGTGAGRDELHAAREIFERTGPATHLGDCWMLLAQLECRAGRPAEARAAVARMDAAFGAGGIDAERLAAAAQVRALIDEQC
jgi:tetratricopeptide (TPR) repeat protein